jgi:hypothetical protein
MRKSRPETVDPRAAPVVRRIFDECIHGSGIFAIAEGLSRDGNPSPSAHDPERNPHRRSSNGAWGKSAVKAILGNFATPATKSGTNNVEMKCS